MPPQDTVRAAASVKRPEPSCEHTAAVPREVRCADLLPPAPWDILDTETKSDPLAAELSDVHYSATSGTHDMDIVLTKPKPNANGHLWSQGVLAVPVSCLSLVYQLGADTSGLP